LEISYKRAEIQLSALFYYAQGNYYIAIYHKNKDISKSEANSKFKIPMTKTKKTELVLNI